MMHLYWVALKSIWAKEIHRFMRIWAVSYTHLTLPTIYSV